jgi:DNA-binding CsgD family transcriptional regulator/PAS domain-containing protein
MGEQQRLTSLISNIYDTALDTALWPDVLAAVADFVGGQATGLLVKDTMNKCVAAHYHARVDPHYMQLYRDTYSSFGPVATSLYCDVDRVVSIPELVPYEEYRRSRFYREWARPQGWIDIAIAVLEKSTVGCSCLSVVRCESNGMVDDEMRRRIALVTPHLRRAMLINRTIDFKEAQAAALADVLDGLTVGVFLLDSNGRIVHANAAANEILDTADFLRSSCGRLVAGDARADQAMRETAAVAADGEAAAGVKGIAVPLTAHNGDRYVAHMLPLTSGARRNAGAAYAAAVAVFVRKATLQCSSPPEVIGKTYTLTPAELRVLVGIVEIGGVPEVAAELGVADATVKTHLRRLFEKTGTSRQADLVKLVAGFATPLAG